MKRNLKYLARQGILNGLVFEFKYVKKYSVFFEIMKNGHVRDVKSKVVYQSPTLACELSIKNIQKNNGLVSLTGRLNGFNSLNVPLEMLIDKNDIFRSIVKSNVTLATVYDTYFNNHFDFKCDDRLPIVFRMIK